MLSHAQTEQGIMYGTISLKNGATYKGQIRWEDEEACWDHMFDAPKHIHPTQNLLSKTEAERVNRRQETFKLDFMQLWEDKSPQQSFSFRCQFGDIISLSATSVKDVMELTLRDGSTLSLIADKAGDLDEDILIYDQGVGQVDLDIEDIQSIRFMPAPVGFDCPMGYPMYGRLLTTNGLFEGYITWDSEECLSNDLISGDQKGVSVDIAFKDISTITAQHDGAQISLKSGRTIFLNDHDDVSRGNNGITVHSLDFGTLTIRWKNFISVELIDPPQPPKAYSSFAYPKLLKGTVTTHRGSTYQGQIIYDLDEIYNIEYLNGENNDFKYYIPFQKIDKVVPQNDKYAIVYLVDDTRYVLGDNADVTSENHGLVLKMENDQAVYINWEEIKEIDFE